MISPIAQLLGSFFLQCVTFLLFWSSTSFYGFCRLRSGHRLDSSHLFTQYFRMKPQDFPLESCRGKKIEAVEKTVVAGKQFFGSCQERQRWTKSFIKEGRALVEYLAEPNPSCWYLWTFIICVYLSKSWFASFDFVVAKDKNKLKEEELQTTFLLEITYNFKINWIISFVETSSRVLMKYSIFGWLPDDL